MTSFLSLRGIGKSFGATRVLDGIDLDIEPGEFVCLLGPSGCGKTTLLRIVCGIERADSGQILLGGQDIAGLPPAARGFGVVFQSYALFPNLTAAQNIAYGLHPTGALAREMARRSREMLDLVGLAAHADKYPVQLSGGQQQRVALARALCCWTSRSPRSTRRCARACAARSARCKSAWASSPSWSRTTRKKPSRWPTAWC
jgi:iron(III) transport system ATP-binding protein